MKYFYILSIFLFSINKIINQNLCNLKIANSELASFKGGNDLIYDDGILNDNWSESNFLSPHTADGMSDMEYFYATEIHLKSKIAVAHTKIVINSL
jgi:hypothetical protein